ncbi:MAG: hypothetical protein QF570_01370 [Myxococcota bacterium]|nr:hypothetical protein [Myxococcota bacterium]
MSDSEPLLLSSEDRRVARLCFTVLGLLTLCMWTGIAMSPYLVNNHPLLLIALAPVSRHIVLVVPVVGGVAMIMVAGARHMAFTTFAFLLGRRIGEPGIAWLEARAEKSGRFVRWLQRFFRRWGYFAVFVFPLGAMAAIAGMARMNPKGFFSVAVAGVVFRLGLLALVASSLREPILWLLEIVRRWQGPATLACIALVAVWQFWKWRKRQANPEKGSLPYGLS